MNFGRAIAVVLLAIPAVAVTPAHAAQTRAEYIAQVDPICQSFVGPVNDAARVLRRDHKEWERRLTKGTLKGWVKQTHRTARSILRLAEVDARLTDQIATVSAPPGDAGIIGTWLNFRRQSVAFATSAAKAFGRFKFEVSDRRLRRAGAAQSAARDAISGFGFQVCGVNPAV
jgi:hypothetical protein